MCMFSGKYGIGLEPLKAKVRAGMWKPVKYGALPYEEDWLVEEQQTMMIIVSWTWIRKSVGSGRSENIQGTIMKFLYIIEMNLNFISTTI